MTAVHATRQILRARAGAPRRKAPDALAVEEPLEIRVEGRPVAVTMRTPGHDPELAAGFLLTEGVIAGVADIFEISPCGVPDASGFGNVIEVSLRRPDAIDFARLTRHVFGASSCGLCGKATIDSVLSRHRPLAATEGLRDFPAAVLARLPARLARGQAGFRLTGGLHAAAVFNRRGEFLVLREDVGRHNAVDKALGHLVLAPGGLPRDCGLLVSGRISFEITQKALAAGIAVIAGISAPTSLAMDFARSSGQALVGFLRSGRHNVYAGASRLR
jgi:FdhD protein